MLYAYERFQCSAYREIIILLLILLSLSYYCYYYHHHTTTTTTTTNVTTNSAQPVRSPSLLHISKAAEVKAVL